MRKRSTAAMVLAFAFIASAICVGGSLAYSARQKSAHDTFSTGHIHVKLVNEKGNAYGYYGVIPSAEYGNSVYAENTGEYDAWVRISIELDCRKPSGESLPNAGMYPEIDDENWIYSNGYYYYKKALHAGEKTCHLYDRFVFDGSLGNSYRDAVLYENIRLEAVQCANNGSSPFLAEGWQVNDEIHKGVEKG